MKVLIILKGGSASIEGEVEQNSEEEFNKHLNTMKEDFFLLNNPGKWPYIVPKSSIGYITRKQ